MLFFGGAVSLDCIFGVAAFAQLPGLISVVHWRSRLNAHNTP